MKVHRILSTQSTQTGLLIEHRNTFITKLTLLHIADLTQRENCQLSCYQCAVPSHKLLKVIRNYVSKFITTKLYPALAFNIVHR
jgi:hypothetical protein